MSLLPANSLRRNTAWMLFGQGMGYIMRALYFIVLARLLGVREYGVVVGAFAYVNLVAQYSRAGTGMVLLRYVSADRSKFAVYWGNVLVVTSVMSGILILVLWALAPVVLAQTSILIVVLLAFASCLFEQITVSATQCFQAFEKASYTALFNQLTSLARAVIALAMLLLMHRATALQWAIASTGVSILTTIIAVVVVNKHFGKPSVSLEIIRQRAGEGLEYAFAASTSSAYDDLDKTMLSHYGMNAANGIYAMAYRIIEIASSPIVSIQLAAEPRLFQYGEEGLNEAYALIKRVLHRLMLLSLGLGAAMFLFAPLIPFIVGKSFSEAVIALRWLCIIPLFRSIHYMAGSVLTCAGMQRRRTYAQLAAAGFNFLLNLWLIPRFGWRGAAWASLATDGGLGLLTWIMLQYALAQHKRPLVFGQVTEDQAS